MSQPLSDPAKPHVLVINRNFGIQHFIRNMLSDVCDTDAAFSAAIAYALLEERTYDLIIASVDVLGRDHGLYFLNAVKALPDAPPIPVIGLISNGLAEDYDLLLSQGFTEVVSVWPNLRELEPTVLRIINAVEHLQDTLDD